MDLQIIDRIKGARNLKTMTTSVFLFLGGLSFFLAGFSSYLKTNLLFFTTTSDIKFIPQGMTMLFYGTLFLAFSAVINFFIFLDFGSGYNEFSKLDNTVRILRLGLPGKNRLVFLSYEFKMIQNLKLLIKQGLNPRCNILLVLKDKREIPLFPPQFLGNVSSMEKKAISLSNFLNVPLEILQI